LPDCLCCGLDQGQVVSVVFKNWGGCVLIWSDVGAVSYLCAVGVNNAFNVSLTIPPHLSSWTTCKTSAGNQWIAKSEVKKGLLLFDGKALRAFAPSRGVKRTRMPRE